MDERGGDRRARIGGEQHLPRLFSCSELSTKGQRPERRARTVINFEECRYFLPLYDVAE